MALNSNLSMNKVRKVSRNDRVVKELVLGNLRIPSSNHVMETIHASLTYMGLFYTSNDA